MGRWPLHPVPRSPQHELAHSKSELYGVGLHRGHKEAIFLGSDGPPVDEAIRRAKRMPLWRSFPHLAAILRKMESGERGNISRRTGVQRTVGTRTDGDKDEDEILDGRHAASELV